MQQGEDTGRQTVFVFGSNVAGLHREATAAFAVRHHGAEEGKWNGPTGNTYAIPYRSSKLELLDVDVIGSYVDIFLDYARQRPTVDFRVNRFGCGVGQHTDEAMCRLFRAAPANCLLGGVWQRTLSPPKGPRILLADPTERLKLEAGQRRLRQFLEERLPIGRGNGELISLLGASSVRINETLANVLGFSHRLVQPNPARFGTYAGMASELDAIWHATHLISVADALHRTQPLQIRLMATATREGLEIHELTT